MIHPRMTIIIAALTLALAACNDPAGDGADITPTATPPTTTDSTPPSTTIPDKPATFDAYSGVIAAYLPANPPAPDGAPCLEDLYAAWSLPHAGANTCRTGNTDDDLDQEVAAVIIEPTDTGIRYEVVVFDPADGAYTVAYTTGIIEEGPGVPDEIANAILHVGDVNADGGGEIAYNTPSCGANTCYANVQILGGRGGTYVSFTPTTDGTHGGISLSFADVRFDENDGDPALELVITGGTQGSVGAGPTRERTEYWDWDGSAYVLAATQDAPPTYLYHAILDADALMLERQFAAAEQAYLAAVADDSLELWDKPDERIELQAHALFRAAVARLAEGADPILAIEQLDRAVSLNAPLHSPLAATFRDAYTARQDLSIACNATRDYINANVAPLTDFWYYGYANPEFTPTTLCPY